MDSFDETKSPLADNRFNLFRFYPSTNASANETMVLKERLVVRFGDALK
jgi:hypothetical protein